MIDAVIFDKDGTLFDFRRSWGAWAGRFLAGLAPDPGEAARLGRAIGYDTASGEFAAASPVIAGTVEEIAAALAAALPGADPDIMVARINAAAATAEMVAAAPLQPLLDHLRGRGLRLGVATNDAEAPARTHLAAHGILDRFDFVAGYDSGWGGKPGPGMLTAFADRLRLAPARVAMVGDSRHDLIAGRAAGMRTVAVLSGMTAAADLAPLADAVLPDVGHLPGWIDRLTA